MFFKPKAFVAHFFVILCVGLLAAQAWSVEQKPKQLINKLQKGGYVIYWRHAQTDHSQVDRVDLDLNKCDTQRNLSKQGREQASVIGQAFRSLNIPVGSVLSSPYCRCKDTAILAFGRMNIDNSLYFSAGMTKKERQVNSTELLGLFSEQPEKNTNTVIVSHTSNLKEATGIWPKPEAVMHVFKPNTKGYEYIGMIPPGSWLTDLPNKQAHLTK